MLRMSKLHSNIQKQLGYTTLKIITIKRTRFLSDGLFFCSLLAIRLTNSKCTGLVFNTIKIIAIYNTHLLAILINTVPWCFLSSFKNHLKSLVERWGNVSGNKFYDRKWQNFQGRKFNSWWSTLKFIKKFHRLHFSFDNNRLNYQFLYTYVDTPNHVNYRFELECCYYICSLVYMWE